MLQVVLVGEPEQAGDIEPSVRLVRTRACPTGFVEGGNPGEGRVAPVGEQRDGPVDRLAARPVERPGLDPAPVRVATLREVGQPGLEDLALNGDEMEDDLARRPRSSREVVCPVGRESCPLDPGSRLREPGEQLGSPDGRARAHEAARSRRSR